MIAEALSFSSTNVWARAAAEFLGSWAFTKVGPQMSATAAAKHSENWRLGLHLLASLSRMHTLCPCPAVTAGKPDFKLVGSTLFRCALSSLSRNSHMCLSLQLVVSFVNRLVFTTCKPGILSQKSDCLPLLLSVIHRDFYLLWTFLGQ